MKPFHSLRRVAAAAPLLLTASLVQADSAATGLAQIDWRSVDITAQPGTQFSVAGHEASILFADNVVPTPGGTPYVMGASDTASVLPGLQASRVDAGLGRQLSGQVDLGGAQLIAAQYSRVNTGSARFDASNASWMLVLHSAAGGEVRVTGDYLLGLSAAVQQAGDSVDAAVFANIRLYDPGSNQVLFDDARTLGLSLDAGPVPTSASRAGSGSFDDLVTLPAGRDVRLFFTVSSSAMTAAVPEPQSLALLPLGLLALFGRSLRRRAGSPA